MNEDVKAWLLEHNRSRDWLARQCRVAKKTVDGWLSEGRPIPGPARKLLEGLMATSPDVGGISLELLFRLDRAREVGGFRTLEEFFRHALETVAGEILESSGEVPRENESDVRPPRKGKSPEDEGQ